MAFGVVTGALDGAGDPPPAGPSPAERNIPAAAALVAGLLSVPTALTYLGGIVFGLTAIIVGFVGVARSHHLEGRGEGMAVAGIILGALGMSLPAAMAMFLA